MWRERAKGVSRLELTLNPFERPQRFEIMKKRAFIMVTAPWWGAILGLNLRAKHLLSCSAIILSQTIAKTSTPLEKNICPAGAPGRRERRKASEAVIKFPL